MGFTSYSGEIPRGVTKGVHNITFEIVSTEIQNQLTMQNKEHLSKCAM